MYISTWNAVVKGETAEYFYLGYSSETGNYSTFLLGIHLETIWSYSS